LDKNHKAIKALGLKETARIEETLNYIAKAHRLKLPSKLQETEAERESKKLIPKRLFKGTLSRDALQEAVGEKEYEWYLEMAERDQDFNKKLLEVVNFMDGRRTIHGIFKAVSAEYDETNFEHTLKFVRELERAKLVVFK